MIKAEIDAAGWQKIEDRLKEIAATFVPRSGARALNRAATSGRVVAVRDVAYALGTKQSAVKPYIRIRQARPEHLEARIFAVGKFGIPLIKLDPSGPEPSRGHGGGVRVKATPGTFPRAFISTMPKSGRRGVFERRGKARLPIFERRTPPVPQVLRHVRRGAIQRASESLRTNLVSELRYAVSRTAV
jgi:minor tail protein Z (GPZ)